VPILGGVIGYLSQHSAKLELRIESLSLAEPIRVLEFPPGNVPKNLLVQAQLDDQALELAVLLLQLFQPLRLYTFRPPYSLRHR
jgi:hypothetical protein